MMTERQKVWVVGCGDIGQRLAHIYQAESRTVNGLVNSDETTRLCLSQGIPVLQLNLDSDDINPDDFGGSVIYYFAPPPSQGEKDTRLVRFLSSVKGSPQRIVLISTTGVYGDCDGEWIDEGSPVSPKVDRARRRAYAESALQEWKNTYKKEIVILRVPGIYANDRLPISRLEKQLPVLREDIAPYTNRIHADDLASICKVAMETAVNGSIYNVTDGHPVTMTDYFNHVADYAGLPRPPQISLEQAEKEMSPGMMSYLRESRRISNDKLIKELSIKLKYPDLDSALPVTTH